MANATTTPAADPAATAPAAAVPAAKPTKAKTADPVASSNADTAAPEFSAPFAISEPCPPMGMIYDPFGRQALLGRRRPSGLVRSGRRTDLGRGREYRSR